MTIAGPTPAWQITPTPGYQLNSVAISADGATLLTGTSIESESSDSFGIYCYSIGSNSVGQQLWSDPLGKTAHDGVFWVALSADGKWAAAGGSYGTGAGGFVRLYNVAAGPSSKQEFATTDRVNEIEMSADGSLVVACYASQLDCYVRRGSRYALGGSQLFSGCYARSCGLNPDSGLIVVGGDVDSGMSDGVSDRMRDGVSDRMRDGVSSDAESLANSAAAAGPGFGAVLGWDGTSLTVLSSLSTVQGVRRIVISGAFVAASTRGGAVSLWCTVIGPVWQLAWTMSPSPALGIIYALAIAQTGTTVWIGGGGNATGNAHGTGGMFAIQSVPNPDNTGFTPTQIWHAATTYPPNPATYFDANALYLTAADGEPGTPSETPGQFYLFNARSGALLWTYKTTLMNWGMNINANGTACVGGSDDGSLYYWGAPGVVPQQ